MDDTHAVRLIAAPDRIGLPALYRAAFPLENLLPLVDALTSGGQPALSFVAAADGALIGHACATTCAVEGASGRFALLGPVAVTPERQGRGVGSALVQACIGHLRAAGFDAMLVLGGPRYYARFGFTAGHRIQPPYPLKPEWLAAWQALTLQSGGTLPEGRLRPPSAWLDPSLWA